MSKEVKDDAFWDFVMDSDQVMFWINEVSCLPIRMSYNEDTTNE